MRLPFRATLLLGTFLLSACQRDANPSNYTLNAPEAKDLAGTYLPTARTT